LGYLDIPRDHILLVAVIVAVEGITADTVRRVGDDEVDRVVL